MKKRKATVKQNRWGNWFGYIGGRRVTEFASDVAFLVATDTATVNAGSMPEAAAQWLAEQNGESK